MSKWYMVKVTTVSMVLVEVDDEERPELEIASAQQVAMDNTSGDDIEAEIESGPLFESELEAARRHADTVLSL
jgi:hypothetical protein